MSSSVQQGVVVDGRVGEKDIAHTEHAATLVRLKRVAVLGLAAWLLFGLVDLFVLAFVHPGRWYVYAGVRLTGALLLGLAALRIYVKPRPSMKMLRFIDVSVFAIASALISVTCLEAGGITSSLVLGVIVVLITRGALLADHWRRALLPVSLVVLAHPVTLAGLAFISPAIAAQFLDAASLGVFTLNQLFLVGAAALTLAGGHSVWTLQRKVFEARSLGRYRLIKRIGKGGMGEVWEADHRTLKRKVAVKILLAEKVDPQSVARFEREVQATAELTHPNTVRVFDFGATEDGLFYYAMELLSGADLGAVLRREGSLTPRRAVNLMRQAAQALAEAHARGIIHRDIKPGNLFVSDVAGSGEMLKVLDFGLARLRASDEVELTREGFAVGTPSYIAPETLKGEHADARSDVYALGCVLYHALAGKPPFAHKEMLEVMRGHLNQDPPPLPSGVPEVLQKVVTRCLAKDPAQRFDDASRLAEALVGLEAEVHSAMRRAARQRAARAERPSREHPPRERPSRERPSRERPSREHPSGERPARERPSRERPSRERPSRERPSRERPSQEQGDLESRVTAPVKKGRIVPFPPPIKGAPVPARRRHNPPAAPIIPIASYRETVEIDSGKDTIEKKPEPEEARTNVHHR